MMVEKTINQSKQVKQ